MKIVKVGEMMAKQGLSSSELAHELGLAAATVQLYAREGRIPFETTPGGHRRFVLDDVRAMLTAARGRKASPAERIQATAVFGPSRRARLAMELRGARTTSADVDMMPSSEVEETIPEWPTHSAVVDLLKDATQVYFSTARR